MLLTSFLVAEGGVAFFVSARYLFNKTSFEWLWSMIETIYKASPVFVQNLICTVYGWREGRVRFSKAFRGFLLELLGSEFFDYESIERFKSAKLADILIAAKASGIYQVLSHIDDDDIRKDPWEIFGRIDVLRKTDLLELDMRGFRAASTKLVSTSGTTGKALSLVKDKESLAMQWAVWFRHRARFGVKLGDLSVNFTGKPVVPLEQSGPPYWRFNAAQNQYLVSMQHINGKNIGCIVDFLNSIRPVFYSGYPSIIAEVSRLALESGLHLREGARPSVIFTGAENLLDYQEEAISKWTGAVVTDQYGLTEGCCNFSKCEHGNYHEDFEFCHVEICDPEYLEDGSVRGKLIGTGFYNYAFPLLRYETGDIATMAPAEFRCPCGRSSRVIFSVEGRTDDYVVTPDGRRVMRFDYLFKGTYEVLEAQVIQERLGEIVILSVPSNKGNLKEYEDKVRVKINEYISEDMKIVFRYTSSIPKSSTGKFKAVLNRLD